MMRTKKMSISFTAATAAKILGTLCAWLSFLFVMLVVGDELANSDYRDYGARAPCHLNTVESQRVYSWTLVALFSWLTVQAAVMLKHTNGPREYFEKNHSAQRSLNAAAVGAAQIYLGALFLLATHFEWGLTCNNTNGDLQGANFIWGAAALHIVAACVMHWLYRPLAGRGSSDEAGSISFRAEHLVNGAGGEKMTLLTGYRK